MANEAAGLDGSQEIRFQKRTVPVPALRGYDVHSSMAMVLQRGSQERPMCHLDTGGSGE